METLAATDTGKSVGIVAERNIECLTTRRTQKHVINRRDVHEKCLRNRKSNPRDVVTAVRLER